MITQSASKPRRLVHCLLLLTACHLPPAFAQEPSPADSDRELPEGISFIEEVTQDANGDDIRIPYRKYELDNGLTLLIHEDTSDPLVHVDVTYHVGSAREEPRRSGFAHFFEHMMFQGSEHVGDDEHFRIVTEAGGTMNGTTNFDRTNYFQTVPSNQLETMLWLESDRMGWLLPAVTQEKFEVQRDTVKNERGQNVENRPYGRFNEVNNAALYPPEHPYSWPVIGYPQDLDAATLEDLRNFFLRWYGPNNATLSVGGNVDKDEAIELALKYFGEIPPGPPVAPQSFDRVELDQDRYVSYVDSNIRFPGLLFTFPTVPLDHPDRVALDALNEIIGVGRRSFFYKEFVLPREAIEASAFHNSMELAGSITFFVLPFPGTPLSQFEEEMRAVFDGFDEDSVTEEDIQVFKAQREASLINSLASVRGKVSQLAYYETFLDDPDNIRRELEDIRSLTREDVLRVFDTYVKDQHAVIQSIIPRDDEDLLARPDNYEIPPRAPRPEAPEEPLPERAVDSDIDRGERPEPGPAPLINMPDYWRADLDRDIEVIGTTAAEVPVVNVRLVFEGGQLLEQPEAYGLASLTAAMLNEGTERLSAEQFETELRKLGSNISVSAGRENMVITMQSLLRNVDETLELLEQRLFEYEFTEEDLERLRQQQIESIEAGREQPSTIASNAYRALLWGQDHPRAVPVSGEVETLRELSLDDVSRFAQRNLVANALQVTVVGDVPQQEMTDKLGFLENLPDEDTQWVELVPPPAIEETRIYLVDKPGAPQSEIRIGFVSDLTYDPSGEYFERYLMNYPLGGAFSSRINLNLREDKGYTYGARTGFSASRLPGPFTASASVRADATADAITQFMQEMTQYREDGITEEELRFTQEAIGQSEALDYETPGQKAGLLQRIITYNLESDFVREQQDIIRTMTRERINELARRYLPVEEMNIVVVGDQSVIGPSLQELGYEVVELEADDLPLHR